MLNVLPPSFEKRGKATPRVTRSSENILGISGEGNTLPALITPHAKELAPI